MRRWGIVLVAFALAVIAWLVWPRGNPSAPDEPARAEAITAPSTARQPRLQRPAPVDDVATVRGVVRDATNRALAGAQVCAVLDTGGLESAAEPPCTTSDARGAYHLVEVPLSANAVTAAAPRHRGLLVWLESLAADETRDGIDFMLRAGVRVHGRVIDVRGAPIAGATVTSVVSVRTGDDGRFELWVEAGHGGVHASAEGFAGAHRRYVAPVEVEITLHAAGSIAGVVVDDATNAPVPGARVHTRGNVVLADDEGRFELGGLGRDRYVIEAHTPDRAGRTFEIPVGLAEHVEGVMVRVRPAHQLAVRLRRADGSVCRDPGIQLDSWGADAGSRWRDGELLVFDGVPPGRYVMTSRCGSDERTIHPPLDVSADAQIEITGKAPPTGRLIGKIDGRADEVLHVWISGRPSTRTVTVDPDGRFETSLEPGVYKVRAGGQNPETPEISVDVVAGRDTPYSATLASSVTGRLALTVVDRAGTPLPGLMVTLTSAGTTAAKEWQWTDSEGRVHLRIAPGEYTASTLVLLGEVARGEVKVHVVAGAERAARLVVDGEAWAIRGVVVDGAGMPVPDATVLVHALGGGDHHAVTGADGRFALPRAEYARNAEIVAHRPGGGASAAVRLEKNEPVRLVLEVPASLSGTVAMADGSVPSRFDIILKVDGQRTTRTFVHSSGMFSIASAPSGPLKLGAAINGIDVWTDLTLAPGEQRTGLALILPAVAAVTGRVVDAGSRTPVEGVKLNLMCTRDGELLAFNHADQRTGTDGRFQIRELPPGPCVVEVLPPGSTWLRGSQTITVPSSGTGDVGEITLARAAP